MAKIYGKYKNMIEKLLFPAVLLIYPLIKINQGMDVADSTYSLANFQYFGQMDGTWMVATFLANVTGSFFMKLPFGGTLIGMNFYTSLVLSATAVMAYLVLRKWVFAPLLFVGEFMALGLCWCPSTVLYNYLTYFLMTAAILFIFCGLTGGRTTFAGTNGETEADCDEYGTCGAGKSVFWKRQRLCFAAAGVCLGANVAVRMPNVVQAAFILAVWYGVVRMDRWEKAAQRRDAVGKNADEGNETRRSLPWRRLLGATGWCLLGYAVGFGVPLALICIRYGVSAYPDMVFTMFAMTDQATDYKPAAMLTGMFGDYGKGLHWLAFAGVCAAAAGFAFWVREWLYGAGKKAGQQDGVRTDARIGDAGPSWNAYRITGVIIKTAYVLLLLVLLRFYWGRGMFHFRYYMHGNGSIYYPAVLLLLVTIAAGFRCLIGRKACEEQKIMAALVLLQIFLTPLGSNNDLYPIVNNLFVAAPFLLWVVNGGIRAWDAGEVRRGSGEEAACAKNRAVYDFVWRAPTVFLIMFVMVQSIGSHINFVFQDGIYGEPRDTRVKTPKKAAGVYTTLENAALLEELSVFAKEEGLTGQEAITYEELPGLHYFLDMPPALSTIWPDLESYRMTEYLRDMEELSEEMGAGKEPPVIIVPSAVAAYWSDDGEAIGWFGVDTEAMASDGKLRILWDFVREYGYVERFGNARYVVYMQ